MAELKRIEEELPAAELATYDTPPEEVDGPKLVKGQEPKTLDRSKVQTGFVDEPRRSVEDADKLVTSVMQRLAEGFANERWGLEKQWDHGDSVSTEELRVALQRYRSFFDRLLKL
jgi:hypothetical protein